MDLESIHCPSIWCNLSSAVGVLINGQMCLMECTVKILLGAATRNNLTYII